MSNLSGTSKLYRYDFLPFCKFLYHINAEWIMGQGNFGKNLHRQGIIWGIMNCL